ncbi:uncharacterized protein LOC122251275 isoform X1 [Penaeus japonicus]|uniref:uncharacterized protein LOC122251275 isoform X1 n=1 Tax=Penaeus japonicus TaxID=27405 RepID=UPI001C70F8DF|nr:uncharacterized protein LOC122251275 isoform X1 [Penaeus japonicus]
MESEAHLRQRSRKKESKARNISYNDILKKNRQSSLHEERDQKMAMRDKQVGGTDCVFSIQKDDKPSLTSRSSSGPNQIENVDMQAGGGKKNEELREEEENKC